MKRLVGTLLSGLRSVVRLFRKPPQGPFSPEADNYRQSGGGGWPFII
ncbi:hypothetical protein KCMC57_up56580 [Kitasatospora sp. CMC57]|uniref:Uncharacterized protein n=1 Tax=Kitasatospora sp. CMC57 TaxID=3231513 RepID=A0AB33K3D5_9ACTN